MLSNGVAWVPTVGPQLDAYVSAADETFYGGAAGGGKTDLLCGLALNAHRRSILYRREMNQCNGIVERMTEIVKSSAGYNGAEHRWNLAHGRMLRLGGVKDAAAMERYQGKPYDLIAFDEITQFLRRQYEYLTTWNRTTVAGQRCRVVCTGNPPTTPEGAWVIDYWAPWLDADHPNPAQPGELRYFVTGADGKDQEVDGPGAVNIGGETITPRSRTFIAAQVEDNPFLMRTGYKQALQNLPGELRAKFLNGDFHAGHDDNPMQVIPTAWVEAAQARWRPDGARGLPMSAVGADIARGGQDFTAVAPRHDHWFGAVVTAPGAATPDGDAAAALIVKVRQDLAPVHIDLTGVGTSPYDTLKRNKIQVVAFVAAGASPGRDATRQLGFFNKRAEAWWRMREALDPDSGQDLALPPDRELRADLASARYELTPRGIKVEPKDAIIARLGRSPDRGEAVILARYAFRKVAPITTGAAVMADTNFGVMG